MKESKENRKLPVEHLFSLRKAKLVFYDLCVLIATVGVVYGFQLSLTDRLSFLDIVIHFILVSSSVLLCRAIGKLYAQIWRYSRTNSYLRLIFADFWAGWIYVILERILPVSKTPFLSKATIIMTSLLGAMLLRFMYSRIFELSSTNPHVKKFFKNKSLFSRICNRIIYFFTGVSLFEESLTNKIPEANKIKIAIIGAGRVGAMLAEELIGSSGSVYIPVCFIDTDKSKIGRVIMGLPVLSAEDDIKEFLDNLSVQEVVFAINMDVEKRKKLYEIYSTMGYKIKVYTFPMENTAESGKRQIREFDTEELLFRQQVNFLSDETKSFYHNKVVLVSGGGGSIGSELSRQIAKMEPKQLVLLDIYENNVYDVQQEMRLLYGNKLNLAVEIASVRDAQQLDKVFRTYKPQIVLHAAAHKHVPLMEHNCSEAVKNNVFGTWNMVNVAEKYGVEKFIMISTDKAVNPTNVMGATKRMCEMIVLSRAGEHKGTSYSCTRFGNVLGSNGSVIPLFKRQIANGGPVTLTDKRIIRYFMTIPEASQLVLTSGAMAKSGELFVLDMGRPVKILNLAENMIRLSGLEPYKDIEIKEIGLRPGEKLYEELLIKTETLSKTDNKMIFVEKDDALSRNEIEAKLNILAQALKKEDDDVIKAAMKQVVPTYKAPEEVNKAAIEDGKIKSDK